MKIKEEAWSAIPVVACNLRTQLGQHNDLHLSAASAGTTYSSCAYEASTPALEV